VLILIYLEIEMPTYDYRCSECGYTFEDFQSIKAEPLRSCPECQKESLKRLLGAGAGLIFKGSGFYITDYKNNGNGNHKTKDSVSKEEDSTTGKNSDKESSPKTSATTGKEETSAS
jgi:putative FmdB family regulatory protein